MNDLQTGLRSLARRPGYCAAAALTLALGVGANVGIFSVVRAVLLERLPYPRSQSIVSLLETSPMGRSAVSPANLADWRARSHVFAALAAYQGTSVEFHALQSDPEQLAGLLVDADFFAALGVSPALGRAFTAADAQSGAEPVAIISQALSERSFGSSPSAIGRSVRLDGEPCRVVGVMPYGFRFLPAPGDVWMPLTPPLNVESQRGAHYLQVVGRLLPGITLAAARADLAVISAGLARAHPSTNTGAAVDLVGLQERLVGSVRGGLLMLFGAVVLVIFVAGVNLANLTLAVGAARAGELAVRQALGAGRQRLVRLLSVESALLGLLAGALGLPLGEVAVVGLRAVAPPGLPRLDEVGFGPFEVAFALVLGMGAALAANLVTALRASRLDVASALRASGGRGISGGERLRGGLVIAEVALATVLVAGAGMLARGFFRLQAVSPGFDAQGVLAMQIDLPAARYPHATDAARFAELLLDGSRALPGVTAAGAQFGPPMSSQSFWSSFSVAGEPQTDPDNEPSAGVRVAGPGLFETLRVPLVAGRSLSPADRAGAPRVLFASAGAARRFFPNGDALGKRLSFGARTSREVSFEGEIVGIVGDVRYTALDEIAEPVFYVPMAQAGVDRFSILVRVDGDSAGVERGLAALLRRLDPELPAARVVPLAVHVAASIGRPRFYALLIGLFAVVALLLAAVGMYGVTSYAVSQSLRELAVRRALGAGPADVYRLVLGRVVRRVGIGLAIGLVGATVLTGVLHGLVRGIEGVDPAVLALVGCGFLLLALAAGLAPAWRAAHFDPAIALREER